MPASIVYLRLDENHDLDLSGSGLNLLTDIDAVAQAIQTRLLLFQGEWWEDQNDGLPLWQSILGVGGAGRNLAAINLLIEKRILQTPFVDSIQNLQSTYSSATRSIQFFCEVLTAFGTLVVTNMPTPPDQSLEV